MSRSTAILIWGMALGLLSCSNQPKVDLQSYEETAGYQLGRVVMDETGASSGPILVLRDPSPIHSDEPTAARFRGLREACAGRAFIEAGPDPVGFGRPYEEFLILTGEDWPAQVPAWCEKHPDAVAVVSLLFEFPDVGGWSSKLPPLYGVTAGPSLHWAKAMQRGWLKALVRYRPGVNNQEVPPRGLSRQEVFDLRFELLTAENPGTGTARQH